MKIRTVKLLQVLSSLSSHGGSGQQLRAWVEGDVGGGKLQARRELREWNLIGRSWPSAGGDAVRCELSNVSSTASGKPEKDEFDLILQF